MDVLGLYFSLVLLMILTVSNLFFIKELKKNKIIDFKYKLIFFLICIGSLSSTILFCYYLEIYILIDLFEIEINHASNKDRIITLIIITILNSIINFILSKIYLKKILLSENIKKNDIDLIGKQ